MRILLIEDEIKVANFIERGLKEEYYVVDVAKDGENGIYLAEVNVYDLIILDIMLPGKDGVSVCRELRNKKIDVPILMLTAKDRVQDKVLGLDAGADDYLTKPFAFEELLARVRALLRRKNKRTSPVLKVADLELNQLTHKVNRAGKEIMLTMKEYNLLEYLMLNANHIVTRTMISEHVWNESFDSFTNVIDVYINYLRSKIDKGFGTELIHTIRGIGYILKE
ncbi:transcriptional regulator [candidate division WOR-1 bacterium DG_54_3]|jgi:two-component system copper resistance phosphate regulon response regulator CusR|uniref:Transcriptional regulator n=1 Tax=candidate division WOR-1 bacterium DG_54_3 TaxID=1703775 RepID=A0A0S7XM37_UNCSA|nr:MAG: transcriptional regulator [candidate division WOR-1 bacterium DG_54_3]